MKGNDWIWLAGGALAVWWFWKRRSGSDPMQTTTEGPGILGRNPGLARYNVIQDPRGNAVRALRGGFRAPIDVDVDLTGLGFSPVDAEAYAEAWKSAPASPGRDRWVADTQRATSS